MKISKFRILTSPKLLRARLKGFHPFYYQSALIAKKLNANKNFKTIIDVGANVGEYSRACKDVFSETEIHAFEPSPKALADLRNKKFLKIYDFALTDRDGKFEFNFDENWDSTSSLLEYGKNHRRLDAKLKKIKVEGRRFDNLNIKLKKPCFVKVEVEGAEAKVLEGFGDKLNEIEVLNVTFNFIDKFIGQTKLSELVNLTEKAGFKHFIQVYMDEKKGCELYFFRN